MNRRLVELAEAAPAISPDHANAEATQRSLRKAADAIRRATRASSVPILEAAVADGSLSVEHLDVFMVAVNNLRKDLRPQLLELQPHFARSGARLTVEDFRQRVSDEVRRRNANGTTSCSGKTAGGRISST